MHKRQVEALRRISVRVGQLPGGTDLAGLICRTLTAEFEAIRDDMEHVRLGGSLDALDDLVPNGAPKLPIPGAHRLHAPGPGRVELSQPARDRD